MTDGTGNGFTRRGLLAAFAATAVTAAPYYAHASGFLRRSGDIRRLQVYSARTGERMDAVYWIEGEYVPEVVAEISHFMRDWRDNTSQPFDTRALDIMAAAHRLLEVNEPYNLLSGFRSQRTNNILRSRSRNVAQNSLHLRAQAADLRLRSRSVAQMGRAAAALNAGGVGRYSRSNFVHMDCGPVRNWGA